MRIFIDEGDYARFVQLLSDVLEECDIHCWNYCAMPNHYHLTLEPRRANLSEAIRRLNGEYAQYWNRRHDRVGHVFQGRFKDQIVQREGYLLALSRYVVMNPVRARLVPAPAEWQWSSFRATVGIDPVPAFLASGATIRLMGEGPVEILQARFAEFVQMDSGMAAMEHRFRSEERVLGDRAFKLSLAPEVCGSSEEAA
jgi:putative transposase